MKFTIGFETFLIIVPTVQNSVVIEFSDFIDILASVIQGSVIDPASYVVHAGDLRPITEGNDMVTMNSNYCITCQAYQYIVLMCM